MLHPDSLLKNNTLRNLGYRNGQVDDTTGKAVEATISEISSIADFRCRSCRIADLDKFPDFLQKENYDIIRSYLPTASLFVGTLGISIDRKIKSLATINLAKSVIMNAVANALLDYHIGTQLESEQSLFCPGYSGTNFLDNQEILKILDAQKYIGIYTTESGIMLPEKSIAGLLLYHYKFTCKGCLIKSKCDYLKRKTTCYAKP